MRRPFALLLAFALLFQMTWAVAASYCEHETSPETAVHFGHHVHVHKSTDVQKTGGIKFAVDDDCSYCHAVHAAIIPAAPASFAAQAVEPGEFAQPLLHGSTPARAPDRPQWPRLA